METCAICGHDKDYHDTGLGKCLLGRCLCDHFCPEDSELYYHDLIDDLDYYDEDFDEEDYWDNDDDEWENRNMISDPIEDEDDDWENDVYWWGGYPDPDFDPEVSLSRIPFGYIKANENNPTKRRLPFVFVPNWEIMPSNWTHDLWDEIFGLGQWEEVSSSRYGTRIRFSKSLDEDHINDLISYYEYEVYC
jgi:hypothetical protein